MGNFTPEEKEKKQNMMINQRRIKREEVDFRSNFLNAYINAKGIKMDQGRKKINILGKYVHLGLGILAGKSTG